MTTPAITDPIEIQSLVDSFAGWYHRIQLPGGILTPGPNHCDKTLAKLDAIGLPQDCTGLRVLDISCRDGFFSFELEKRGAEVVGIDYVQPENTGFPIVSKILGSKATYQVENVYNLSPDVHGTFDIVLFLGLLYHLRNPLLAIDRVRSVTKLGGKVFVETHLIDNFVTLQDGSAVKIGDVAPILEDVPLLQFYPSDSLLGDHTNKFGPNMAALQVLFYEGQFDVQQQVIESNRGYLMGAAIYNEALEISRLVDRGTETGRPEVAPSQSNSTTQPNLSGNFWKISESSAAISAALDLQSRQWQDEQQHLLATAKQAEAYALSLKSVLDARETEIANLNRYVQDLLEKLQACENEVAEIKNSLLYKANQRLKRLSPR